MKTALSIALLFFAALVALASAWNPSQCPQDCVRPVWWWEQHSPAHGFLWTNNSEQNTFNCGPSWLDVIESTATDDWTLLAKQYVAANLNILTFTCIDTLPSNLAQALQDAKYQLSGQWCNVFNANTAQWLTNVLKQFNEGQGGVQTCLCPTNSQCPTSPSCPTCPTCPTEKPFQCDEWVIKQCCATPPPATTTAAPTPSPPATTTAAPTPSPCGGCTRTQGYYKTHPDVWTDYVDDVKAYLCLGVDPLTLLNTPSRGGNAYIILGRQFIAAFLNYKYLGVCLDSTVKDALYTAARLLGTDGPACSDTAPYYTAPTDRTLWISTATILDAFNNGLLGPGHCDDGSDTADISQVYLEALEKSYSVENSNFSAAGALVPVAISVLAALLLLVF